MALPDPGDVARMQRIIDRLRSYGVEVREMPGWQTRGFQFPVVPTRIFDHHDASSRKSGEWGALGLIVDGTPRGIPGPLSNFQVARCLDGRPRLAVVAAGYTYHAGTGGPYAELPLNNANPRTYGAEKANDGIGEPYTAAADYATNALFHAAAVESGAIPESFPVGHKEWTPRKSDPTYSMPDRRRRVGSFTPTNGDWFSMATADDLRRIIREEVAPAVWDVSDYDATDAPGESRMGNHLVRVGQRVGALVGHRTMEEVDAAGGLRGILGIPALEARLDAVVARLSQPAPATSAPAAPAPVDYDRIIRGLADELDRRARDGNPATGPVS